MKLIDYYNNEFIADLAIIENHNYYCPIKRIFNGGNFFDERVKELDDERFFSTNIFNFGYHYSAEGRERIFALVVAKIGFGT